MATARHPKATFFVQRHLFSGLTNFAELESKIAALPDEQSRGAAFEVFAEAYLATQRKHDAAQVWPHGSVPLDILKNLGLTQQDQGVDGVLQTLLGQFNAYQIKFRTGRPSLTWRELSTFIGLADSPHIHSRVLLTNCDELPAVLNDRQGFFCIRGADLDRLEAADFRAIEAWLADAAFIAPKKSPQPHQTEALDALLPALQTHDRVSAIMACGTGKTLVALWVAENVARASPPASSGGVSPPVGEHAPGRCLNPPPGTAALRFLILLPSLALLRQTLHEWLRETRLPSLAYLCVCSDPTVKEGIDALTTQQSDLDFQVSTDAASVRRFLDAPFAGVKMIFSTYQSASVVGAAMSPGEAFDFAVFDEAHKTAGREGRNFAFALDDKNLAIRKRLFLTATPRHYNPHDRDREGEARLLFSMDNPAVYGPQAYRLTFAEAARRGIICGYKVIISVITSEMVTNDLLSHGEVLVNGDAVRARQVANQIALRDAIEKYGVKKVFTFHRDVKSAQSFVSAGPEGVGTHLNSSAGFQPAGSSGVPAASPETAGGDARITRTQDACATFQTFHVNGSMPTARRERELRDFRAAARAVVSNARCLTEGVDVPAVDMVAFLSPRRSRVDIVQAIGRAMRKPKDSDKIFGYVLVPVYVEQSKDEDIEDAVVRANFEEVWDVLQSLQEQDEVLAEIIHEMREQRGRTKGFDDSRFRERIVLLGPQINLDGIRAAITTTCIENLGSSWDERFGELVAYKDRVGDCDVPTRYKENRRLATWVVGQRQARKLGELSSGKIEKLDRVGFPWNPNDDVWTENYKKLAAFAKKSGHCKVPQHFPDDRQFGVWVHTQRLRFNSKHLAKVRVAKLEALGFEWSSGAPTWDEMFGALENFWNEHKHFNPESTTPKLKKLKQWIRYQRQSFRDGGLSKERIEMLNRLNFPWTPKPDNWDEMFNQLAKFRAEKGNCVVPARGNTSKLYSWTRSLRAAKVAGSLAPQQVKMLERLDFTWQGEKKVDWMAKFSELQDYKKQFGDCDVPEVWPRNQALAEWVRKQRFNGRKHLLASNRRTLLSRIGFRWK